jgi:serine protease AprX
MTIAVVDSGVAKSGDLLGRNIKDVNFNKGYHDSKDRYGHGTFVATMIAGDSQYSGSAYLGIAPKSQILNVRVSDDQGLAYESDVVAALEWIYTNQSRYNIRVVNLSLNASVATPYHLSPLNAAVELLWFNGIVVVVAAGNNGTAELFPPANDPFVITVGATDDRGTQTLTDDVVGSFSAYGVTPDGHAKPDLVAPGKNIVMYLPRNYKLTMGKNHPSHKVNNNYFRMSGTSLAAPIVSGAVALLLQDEPTLTPDQVKYRLMATANKSWPGYDPVRAGAGYLDIYAAVNGNTTANANTNLVVSQLLWAGSTATWGSVSWNSVSWNSVSWNSVSWNSVSWNSVSWNSDHWDEAVGAAAVETTEPLNAQGLPIPVNVGNESPVTEQAQNRRSFLPLIIH